MKNFIKSTIDRIRRKPLLIKPVVKHSKIDNYEEALRYCVEHKNGTIKELKENLTEDMIKTLSLTGMINI